MSKFGGAVCLLLVSVFISSVSQILLKKAANKTYEDHIREYLNPLVIFAYGMFFCSVILTMLALKNIPLIHAADSGIHRIYFCDSYGILFPERTDRKEKNGRDRTDPAGNPDLFHVRIPEI